MPELNKPQQPQQLQPKRPNNVKTALWVGALALFFFVMLFVKRYWLM